MVYDFDDYEDRSPPKVTTDYKPNPKDLEFISIMIDLAAIFLTSAPGDKFTYQQLLDQITELCGDDVILDEKDIKIVFDNMKAHFKKEPKGFYSLK